MPFLTFLCLSVSNQSLLFNILDSSVHDGLYHEFKKHGDVSRIFVNGQGSSRYAIVHFRRYILVSSYLILDPPKFDFLRTRQVHHLTSKCIIATIEYMSCIVHVNDAENKSEYLTGFESSQTCQSGTLTTELQIDLW